MAQEEKMEHFQQRATEIKVLLHSIEPPLELQVQHVIFSSVKIQAEINLLV